MKEYTIEEFKQLLAKSIRDTIERYAEQYEELLKSGDVHTADFEAKLARMGWVKQHRPGAPEVHYHHPVVTPKSAPFNKGINQTISRGHNMAHVIPGYKVREMLKDGGLKMNMQTGELEAKPGHPYEPLYVESGHHTPAGAGPKVKTWNSGEPNIVPDIPMEQLDDSEAGEPDPYHVHLTKEAFMNGGKVPPVKVLSIDGKYYVDGEGAAVHRAAKQHGMTHAPVQVIG